ncbi:phospholipase A-2-activating protein [Pholiota conissans]|uniref:Phospholipase A-2-activating protein n=1 Tax=Pholiota conissans TaxID=109636 RepID=A0A9P5ZC28_9AGAR|nr:phospholipase A-2-activating protein [Pholiota conissans]
MPYKLSATLKAHTSDVRALSTPTNELILSASRDSTAISWQRSSEDPQFKAELVLRAGSRYVNSVAYISPTPDAPKGYAVTGGQDCVINVFNLASPKDDPDFCLLGHLDNVCTLDVTPGGTIISGSWDKTARIWKNFSQVYELKGHQQSVWAVLGIDEEQYLTGSADKTIKLWQQHKLVQTFTGHQDAVRGLALLPDIGFASCSNDSEIRVWTFGGDVIYTLSGHTSFVYSLSVLPSGDIVSAGEDRSVRVWKDGDCSQTIVHPAISVWAVSTMPNGDIVSGCSDGVVRIFSESEERWATAEALEEYDAQVASQALPSQQVGDMKKSDLPGPEALNAPGKKSGEVKMIKNGEIVEAHQWDSANHTWQKIGDVVDAVGSGRKQLYQGKEYDYVFDVDIQDGVPPLKLPYNVSENPYNAAQKFLQSNDLPLTYIDEVVKFIEKNTAGVNIGTGGEEYVDPFTGASRYRAAPSAPAAAALQYVDPFTGASRYVASPDSRPTAPSQSYADPFTGASRYSGVPSASPPAPAAAKILPVPKLVTFKQANVTAMQGKLFQFDDALRHEISTSSLAMYPDEIKSLEESFAYLNLITTSPPSTPPKALTHTHVDAIISVLERWPPSQRFPVIDLSRLLIGFAPEAFSDPGVLDRFSESLFTAAEWSASWTEPIPKTRETNILLLLRTLANAFQEINQTDTTWLNRILETLAQAPYGVLSKTQRVAVATILFNVSCQGLRFPLGLQLRDQTLSLIAKILESETADAEAVYRALVALGNIAYTAKTSQSLSAVQTGEIAQCLRSLPTTFPDPRVKNVCTEIGELI